MALDPRFFASLVQPMTPTGTGARLAMQGFAGAREADRMREQARSNLAREELERARHAELARQFNATEERVIETRDLKRGWTLEDDERKFGREQDALERKLLSALANASDEDEERAIRAQLEALGRGRFVTDEELVATEVDKAMPEDDMLPDVSAGPPMPPGMPLPPGPPIPPGHPMPLPDVSVGPGDDGHVPPLPYASPPLVDVSPGPMEPIEARDMLPGMQMIPGLPEDLESVRMSVEMPVRDEIAGQVSGELPIPSMQTRKYVTADGDVIDLGPSAADRRMETVAKTAEFLNQFPGSDKTKNLQIASMLAEFHKGDKESLFKHTMDVWKELNDQDLAMKKLEMSLRRARVAANANKVRGSDLDGERNLVSDIRYTGDMSKAVASVEKAAKEVGFVSEGTLRGLRDTKEFLSDPKNYTGVSRSSLNRKIFRIVVDAQGSKPTDKDVDMLRGLQSDVAKLQDYLQRQFGGDITREQIDQIRKMVDDELDSARRLRAYSMDRMADRYKGLTGDMHRHFWSSAFRQLYGNDTADKMGIGKPGEVVGPYWDDKRKRDMVGVYRGGKPKEESKPESERKTPELQGADAEIGAALGFGRGN